MKIAVLICGHLRTFQQTAKDIHKYIIGEHDADFFVSSWNNIDSGTAAWHKEAAPQNMLTGVEFSDIYKFYNPKTLRLEIQQPELLQISGNKISQFYTQYLTKTAVDDMLDYAIKYNVHYDFVIRLRPDISFTKQLPLDTENVASGKIVEFMSNSNAPCGFKKKSRACVAEKCSCQAIDILWCASVDNMRILSDAFDNSLKDGSFNIWGHFEYLLKQNKEVELRRLSFEYVRNWDIERISQL